MHPDRSAHGGVRTFLLMGTLTLLLVPPVSSLPGLTNVFQETHGMSGVADLPVSEIQFPSVLSESWAHRSGFNASLLGSAADLRPTEGPVRVMLTLWPSSPSFFGRVDANAPHLSGGQIGDRFGLGASEYLRLQNYFDGFGLTVASTSPDRLSLLVVGPADRVGSAFGTTLLNGTVSGKLVQFPSSVPTLPPPFGAEVAAISGLAEGMTRFTLPLSSFAPLSRPAQGGSTDLVTPNDVHLIYGLDALYNYSGTSHWATGEGIAVLLWGSGYAPSDISDFFSRSYPGGFPAPTVRAFPVAGAPDPSAGAINDPSNSTREMTLDIEWSASEAPGATIDAVYAPDGPSSNGYSPTDANMEQATDEAVNNIPGVNVISMSFGSQDGTDPPFQAAMSIAFAAAANRGITLLAASGDTGGDLKDGCTGGAAPQFPAASPDVIAVGGTAPVLSENALGTVTGLQSEPDWSLSGGGYSASYAAPSWQLVGSASGPITAHGSMRGMPDVSGPASRNYFYYAGAGTQGSGTSFGTPLWAGLIAEMAAVRGKSFGFITDRLYQLAARENGTGSAGIVDITGGSPTCVASANVGWDAATGWGTPRALPLFEHLTGTYANLNLTADPNSVAPGGSSTITAQVTNATTRAGIAALTVELTMSGTFPGFCSGTLATASGTTASDGTVAVTLTVPACYLGSTVTIAAALGAGGYYGTASLTLHVSLVGLGWLYSATTGFPYNVITFAIIMAAAGGFGYLFGTRRRRSRAAPPGPASAAAPAAVRHVARRSRSTLSRRIVLARDAPGGMASVAATPAVASPAPSPEPNVPDQPGPEVVDTPSETEIDPTPPEADRVEEAP
ncbi:MAG: S53 family peptidase, partial [Thermoplasmata archaeon]|nr:S53 family peptidase [Thermoplasmata archaeon]